MTPLDTKVKYLIYGLWNETTKSHHSRDIISSKIDESTYNTPTDSESTSEDRT